MIITIHRGSNEIGGSCVEIEGNAGTKILVDIGLPLAESAARPLRLPKNLAGALISHAHQDHYGLLSLLAAETPLYISQPTHKLIEITGRFSKKLFAPKTVIPFHSQTPFACGEFRITPYLVDHSAFDAHAFLIEDAKTRIFYSGDFRGHGRKSSLLERFVAQPPPPVDALLLEGTTLNRNTVDFLTESQLERQITEKLKAFSSIAFVCASAQNIDRIVTLFRSCIQSGRKLLVDPYAAHLLREINRHNPSLPFPSPAFGKNLGVYYPRYLCRYMRLKLAAGEILDEFDSQRVWPAEIRRRPGKYLLLVRNNTVADLSREFGPIADGALLLYSLWLGYWEMNSMAKLKNWTAKHNLSFFNCHTSGHATATDLRSLADALAPRRIIPIHTTQANEYDHYFSQEICLATDGDPIRIN